MDDITGQQQQFAAHTVPASETRPSSNVIHVDLQARTQHKQPAPQNRRLSEEAAAKLAYMRNPYTSPRRSLSPRHGQSSGTHTRSTSSSSYTGARNPSTGTTASSRPGSSSSHHSASVSTNSQEGRSREGSEISINSGMFIDCHVVAANLHSRFP